MAGIDRMTGRPLAGFAHVVQSIDLIVATRLGDRPMRRHVGSSLTTMLGKMLSPEAITRWFVLYALALELWEPRFRLLRVIPVAISVEDVRLGRFAFAVEGEYRPRGHLGDPTPEAIRRIAYRQGAAGLEFGKAI